MPPATSNLRAEQYAPSATARLLLFVPRGAVVTHGGHIACGTAATKRGCEQAAVIELSSLEAGTPELALALTASSVWSGSTNGEAGAFAP